MAYEKKFDRKLRPRKYVKLKETSSTETPTQKIIQTPKEKPPEISTQTTTKTESISQSRDQYQSEVDVWKRWRCSCGRVNTVTKTFIANRRLQPGEYFKISCTCGGWEMVFSIPARLRKV